MLAAVVLDLKGSGLVPPTKCWKLIQLTLLSLPLLAPEMVQVLATLAPTSLLVPRPPLKFVGMLGTAAVEEMMSVSLPLAATLRVDRVAKWIAAMPPRVRVVLDRL